ncbi:MAG: D-alanine--D-alanine ligase family protein [Bacillota bacterium]|jgi:D-alanine-D-alanine ligase
MALRTLGLVFGGRSGEHEVSVQSAASVWQAADRDRYQLLPLAISKSGRFVGGLSPLDVMEMGMVVPEPQQGGVSPLAVFSEMDVVFPLLHGPYGEDGTIQGMLEMLDIPYVGAGVLASALAMDKAMAKQLFERLGFPQAPFRVFTRSQCLMRPAEVLRVVEERLGFPCFVKPANLGSSVGITKVHIPDQLPQALALAGSFDRKIVVESFIDGREIECSVLGNDQPQASVPGEIIPAVEFYDYQAKYVRQDSQLLIPAPITPKQMADVQRLAVQVFQAIDGSGLARVDFFIRNGDGAVLVNEINTMPGFTSISMYPKLWEASGLPYPRLIDELVNLAVERYNEKRGLG